MYLFKQVLAWLFVNLFLLLVVLVGAGAFWLLQSGVKALNYGGTIEIALTMLASIGAIFCAYYFACWLHRLISARIH
jgi:hypothetical protein